MINEFTSLSRFRYAALRFIVPYKAIAQALKDESRSDISFYACEALWSIDKLTHNLGADFGVEANTVRYDIAKPSDTLKKLRSCLTRKDDSIAVMQTIYRNGAQGFEDFEDAALAYYKVLGGNNRERLSPVEGERFIHDERKQTIKEA